MMNRRTRRRIQTQLTQLPRRAGGRFTLVALCAFVMFSATFALATAFRRDGGGPGKVVAPPSPAEDAQRELVSERVHLHLKRLHTLASLR